MINRMAMKMFNKNIIFVIVVLLVSCGKYGYDFEDGHTAGDTEPSGIETDTTMYEADKSLYHRARIYPGLVGDNVPRIQDTTITFDLDYVRVTSQDIKVNVTPPAIFSTGLYAPAGENIRVIVPEGVIGLTMQIGVHMDNLSGKTPLRRDPLIYTRKELFPGVNYVKNLYGGTIWILPNQAIKNPVSLQFAGAVRSPDFILGETDQEEWLRDVQNTQVPWIELRSKRATWSVPRSLIIRYPQDVAQIEEGMKEWNRVYEEDYYKWMGLEEDTEDVRNRFPDLPERAVLDIQPSVGYGHSGNPFVGQMDRYWFKSLVDPNLGDAWGTFHEIGHNYQQPNTWSWNGLGETTNNLFVFKTENRMGRSDLATHPALEEAFASALTYAANPGTKNFVTDEEIDDPFKRLTPFLQIFHRAEGVNGEEGWDFMPHVYRAARNTQYAFGLDEAKRDFFYRELCKFTGRDWARFFSAWGIRISTLAKNEMRELYPPIETSIWTYDPWTHTGGDDALPPKYDIDSGDFEYSSNTEVATNDGDGFAALNDGNYSTYWHTCWSGCEVPTALPVTIDMDMQEVQAYKGVYYSNRPHSMVNKRIKVYRSNDGSNWTLLGDYTDLPGSQGQREEIEFDTIQNSRYIRFEFPDPNGVGSEHVALGQMGVFYDVED